MMPNARPVRHALHDGHQRARHPRRIGVLDDVAAVDDPGGALGHHASVRASTSSSGTPAAAAHEHRPRRPPPRPRGGSREVVGRVGLDDVGAELGRLAHERHDLLGVAVDAVAASLHDQRLDHQRHADRVARGAQRHDVADALRGASPAGPGAEAG